ncbi:MAG: histidinol dehydrogenase [Chloroflexi bacterium]|uniref:Histidinol dehydrogenase n=1 Tax=Candidatus Chlorohelix allophototropha TaxID=3003348 RepID=A0A8T7M1R2_9CHLR|nr:histidinol dehydrogenase [Chloroflexota bacterium]WJW65527.1 histidinol dehydrogenase [Chloroflexota bacterium L227-S17]
MQPVRLSEVDPETLKRIKQRAAGEFGKVSEQARAIMQEVRERGDAALRDFTARFDGVQLESLEVSREEIEQGLREASPELVEAFKFAIDNIRKFHRTHVTAEEEHVETVPGVEVWRVWRSIERVGLYVPGGRAPLPSSLLMTAIPAEIAGCDEIIVCTPPNKEGKIHYSILAAVAVLNLPNLRLFKVGGAHAIAAMAYGTESIPKTYKIFGAGNPYVTAAKVLAFSEGMVSIDMPAGPSEVLIIADASANPAYVAADFLSQAEHADDSSAVLLTTSPKLAIAVAAEVRRQLPLLSTADRASNSLEQYGMIGIVETIEQAIEFANDYAPEHLEVCTENVDEVLPKLRNAGTIFVGNFTPEPSGDYVSGLNHVLPTGANTKMFGPLSVESFGKKMQMQRMTAEGLANLRKAAEVMAAAEGLPAHGRAINIRFEDEQH